MKKLMLMGGFVLALGACKNDFDKAMDKASALTDKMCACKDTACADKVREERSALKKEFKATLGDKKPDEDQMKKIEARRALAYVRRQGRGAARGSDAGPVTGPSAARAVVRFVGRFCEPALPRRVSRA